MMKSYYFFFFIKKYSLFFCTTFRQHYKSKPINSSTKFLKKKYNYFGHLIPFAINLSSTVKRFEKCSYVLYIEMPRRFLVN